MLSTSRVKVGIHFIWQGWQKQDMLECIYTARIEAWTVDDWTRVRTAHSNHHLMMTVTWCLMSLSTKTKKKIKSYWDNRTRRLVRVFTVCHFSLGISKSHSRMYLKWTSQKLTSFANSLSLSLSLSLWKALSLSLSLSLESSFFLPSCKYDGSPFELEVVCTDFIGKMISHWRESNAIRSPLIMKHMYLLPSFAPSTASRLALQVSGGRGFGVLVNSLLYKHAPLFTGAIHKKCCSRSHFAWARLVKAIAVNSLLIVSCS